LLEDCLLFFDEFPAVDEEILHLQVIPLEILFSLLCIDSSLVLLLSRVSSLVVLDVVPHGEVAHVLAHVIDLVWITKKFLQSI
jgi:hypothetical protein